MCCLEDIIHKTYLVRALQIKNSLLCYPCLEFSPFSLLTPLKFILAFKVDISMPAIIEITLNSQTKSFVP